MLIFEIFTSINMQCNHQLHYLLKKHDDGMYAGVMVELDGVVAHSKDPNKIEDILKKLSVTAFLNFKDLHEKAINDELEPLMRKSTSGTPQAINSILVECPE